jgi:predicted dehydrogenase
MTSRTSRRDHLRFLGGAVAWSALPFSTGGVAAGSDKRQAPIKIGQIGTGHAHASKLSVYRASPDYEVVGFAEPDAELRARAVSQDPYRDLKVMAVDELLDVPGLQAVLVETRVRNLLDTAEKCIAAGKHVHIDKPAGESLSQYRRILEAAARQKLLVQMGYMYRYSPAVVLLRDFLKRGWLGEVFEVHAVMSKVVDRDSRVRLAEYRGGIMFELGCHIIDLVVGVLGKPERVVPFVQRAGAIDDGLVDNMLAVFEYPRAQATVKSSALEVEGFARRHLVVCGTEGTFHIQPLDDPAATVFLSAARGTYPKGIKEISFPKYTRYVDDAADMARIIRGEKGSDFSYEHDLTVQGAVLEASGLAAD